MLAARDDRDFVLAGPRGGVAPARARPPARASDPRDGANPMQVRRPTPKGAAAVRLQALGSLAAGLRRRFGLLAGLGLAAAGGVAVCVNALGLQTGRHPAPIFAPTEPVRPAARLPRPVEPVRAVVPTSPVQQAGAAPTSAAAPAVPAPVVQTGSIAPLPPRRAEAPARPASRDAIGEMIRATDPAAPASRADRSVAFAQRALARLGEKDLKADGVMGAGTRAAIERFERQQKLPVTGDAAGRTLRELAARSGLAAD